MTTIYTRSAGAWVAYGGAIVAPTPPATPSGVTHGNQLAVNPTATPPVADLTKVGATARGVALTNFTGDVTFSTANATITGRHYTGQCIVRATGITFNDCHFEGGVDCRNPNTSGDTYYPTFNYCTLGPSAGAGGNAQGIAVYHGGYTLNRCLARGFSDGLRMCGGPTTVTESFISCWSDGPTAHCDGVQDPCGYQADVTVDRSYIDAWDRSSNGAGTNAALNRSNDFSNTGNTGKTFYRDNFITSQNQGIQLNDMNVMGAACVAVVTGNIFGAMGGNRSVITNSPTARFTWTNNTNSNGTSVALGAS